MRAHKLVMFPDPFKALNVRGDDEYRDDCKHLKDMQLMAEWSYWMEDCIWMQKTEEDARKEMVEDHASKCYHNLAHAGISDMEVSGVSKELKRQLVEIGQIILWFLQPCLDLAV